MSFEGFKFEVASAMASHVGLSAKDAARVLNVAMKASHKKAYKMFQVGSVGPITMKTEPFATIDAKTVFAAHKVYVTAPSEAVLEFPKKGKRIRLLGLGADFPLIAGPYKFKIKPNVDDLTIYCGLPGDPKVPLPPDDDED